MNRQDELLAELMAARRWVYWVDETATESLCMDKPRYRVSIVIEHEQGHWPTGGDGVEPWYWDHETCRNRNESRGYDRGAEHRIVCSSMFTD